MFRKFFAFNKKVDFMIVGAQKAGTTALYYYLNQIEGVQGSNPKETDFFSYDNFYKKGYKFYHNNFYNGLDGSELYFDASVEYLYLPYVAERLYKYNPRLKLIVCLRDPIDRAVSAYKMYKHINSKDGIGWRTNYLNHLKNHSQEYYDIGKFFYSQEDFPQFETMINEELKSIDEKFNHKYYEPSLVRRGLYKDQIKNLLSYFPIDQLYFVNSKKMKQNSQREVRKILDFLNFNSDSQLETIDFAPQLETIRKDEIPLSDKTREKLKYLFKDSYSLIEKLN